jgi:hypothetical protein
LASVAHSRLPTRPHIRCNRIYFCANARVYRKSKRSRFV